MYYNSKDDLMEALDNIRDYMDDNDLNIPEELEYLIYNLRRASITYMADHK